MNAQKIIILVAYFLVTILAFASTKDLYPTGKRAGDRPFMMGMRYGRSDRGARPGGKHVVVAPRNDRFFIGSRYGKRSSDTTKGPSLVYPVRPLCGTNEDLTCTYTGVSNIYICIQSLDKDATRNNPQLSSI